jgi:LuxR family maltose regulon positive regulatory protein
VTASPRLIDRTSLLAALDRAATGTVTIISAPAGTGKTSLLRSWAARQPGRPAVIVSARQDQLFWLTLLDAVRAATGGAGGAAVTPDFTARAMADRVLAELDDASGITLVIDDLHEVTSAESRAALAHLLTSLPAGVHAILATRHDPRLRLHRLRLAGELTEIRWTDLRFTEDETRELLGSCGVALSDAGVTLLHQRTEGWAAGLRLAAISLDGHPDPERFVAEFSGSDRSVAEYLLGEMLDRQPEEVRRLLLCTSLLDRVNGELADLLIGRAGSERILLELEDANAFVLSLDPERTWFRYHRLLADLLRLELRRTLPSEVPALHRRAAAWFTAHGQIVEAIRHTQAAGDWDDAARLLADHSFSLTLDGHAETLQALARAFPPGLDHPELALVHAMGALDQGRLDDAASYLRVAENHAETAGRHSLQVSIASLKLSLARRRGQLDGVVEQARILTSGAIGQAAVGSDLRAVALMNLGTAEAWSLGLPDAERHLREGAVLAREIGRPYLEVGCLAQLGFASKVSAFAITQRRCREAITLADRYGWGTEPVVAPALITLSGALVWTGELAEGEQWLDRAVDALRDDDGPDIRLLLHQGGGTLRAGQGRHREALEKFSVAERLRSRLDGSHALENQVTGWLLATLARLDRTGEARELLAALDRTRAAAGEIRDAAAVIHLAEGDPAGALAAVRDVLDGAAPVIGYVTVVEAHLLAGLAHRALGEPREASRAAERALALAEPDRLVLPFLITGARDLLECLSRHETAHAALLTDILDIMRGTTPTPVSDHLVEKLSLGELRVLRYLPTNLSRSEIAAELSLSPNTVGTHIRNIYAKLGVGDRTSAVRRARGLHLLAIGRA